MQERVTRYAIEDFVVMLFADFTQLAVPRQDLRAMLRRVDVGREGIVFTQRQDHGRLHIERSCISGARHILLSPIR